LTSAGAVRGGRVAAWGRAFVVEHPGEAVEHLLTARLHRRTGLGGMNDAVACELRLLVEELKQREESRAHTIQLSVLGLEGRARARRGDSQDLIERREQSGLAAREMIVECLA
jgi:GNAT superfamily N-acetyltransferase